MDTVDRKTRSKIMKSIPQKDTKPEMSLRKALHGMGFRYRLHDKKLPGSKDGIGTPRRIFSSKATTLKCSSFCRKALIKSGSDSQTGWHCRYKEFVR